MRLFAITRTDGGVSIMHLLDDNSTVEAEVAKWNPACQDEYVSHKETTQADLPTDREFRNSWTPLPNGKIIEDLGKMKTIKLDQFRTLRQPKLASLDLQFMRAQENGTDTKSIIAQKQALRDITKIELPNSIAELKTFMPNILKE